MPKGVPVTRRVLIEITKALLEKGWKLMRRDEIAADIRKYRIEHHRQPRNVGFQWSDGKGHTVKLWLACDYDLAVEYKRTMPLFLDLPVSFPSGIGMGWALVVDARDRAIYFATPRNRTQNFQENFLSTARITRKRIENWPTCEKCGAEMVIIETKHHGNFWACFRTHPDGKYARKDWNFCLSPDERKGKSTEYRKRAKGRKEGKKEAEKQGRPMPLKAHDVRVLSKRRGVHVSSIA